MTPRVLAMLNDAPEAPEFEAAVESDPVRLTNGPGGFARVSRSKPKQTCP